MRPYKINKKSVLCFIIISMLLIAVGCNNEPSDINDNEARDIADNELTDTNDNELTDIDDNETENSGDKNIYERHFPDYDSTETISYTEDVPNGEETLELIKDEEGTLMGAISEVLPSGYGGPIRLVVIVDGDGTILGTEVLEHEESPGLGDGVEEENFRQQFIGKGLGDSFELELDIDAVSNATITTKAFIEGVELSLSRVSTYLN